jgi:hypothetical protein
MGGPHMKSQDKPKTLSDSDISSHRKVSRRSLLGTLGLGAGIATAAVVGAVSSAQARTDTRRCYRDNDVTPDGRPYDRVTVYCDRD